MHTEDAVGSALDRALDLVRRDDLSDELRRVAFERVFDALLACDLGGGGQAMQAVPRAGAGALVGAGDSLGGIAQRLKVPVEALRRVIEIDDDKTVHIIAPRSRFADTKAMAQGQVALLVAAACTLAGVVDDGWVSQGAVRAATEELGVDDPSNFAANLKRVEGIRLRGSGRTGQLKINAVGLERAKAFVVELGEEQPS